MESFEQGQNKEALKEKAGAWLGRYEEKIKEILSAEKIDRVELIDALWEYGIMGRIAPKDEAEKNARVALEKAVWEGDREDPKLYWRILYSAAAAKNAAEKNYSIMAGSHGYITGAFQGLYGILASPKAEDAFPEMKEGKNSMIAVIDDFIARAKKELEKRGTKPPEKLLPIGAVGKWNGIEVTVENYTDDGLVWLRAEDLDDHTKLYRFTHGRGASPDEINPEDFK